MTDRPATANSPWNLPNAITVSRLALSLALFAVIEFELWGWLATGLFAVAAWTDFLDGYLARRWNQITAFGRIVDPFVDKMLVCGTMVCLLPVERSGIVPWLVLIVFAREMLVTLLRSWLEQQGRDFSASWSGKVKMALQSAGLVLALASLQPVEQTGPFISPTALGMLRDGTLAAAAIATLYSGWIYVARAASLTLDRHPADVNRGFGAENRRIDSEKSG